MIVMHSGITPIPEGWAICDGNEYTYNGITSKTPNLINRFIKAIGSTADIAEVNNPDLTSTNGFTITKDHLPEHSHTFNGTTNSCDLSVISNLSISTDSPTAVHDSDGPVDVVTSVTYTHEDSSHTHTITGTTSEDGSQWINKSIKIEPNYYALIFIMKL
jgi:microcystin-dependent protein